MKIGDFSKLSRISIRMLRHYDDIGLLHPAEIDRFTGYRYYGEEQLIIAGRIQSLRDMGFSLASIREMLENDDPVIIERQFAIREAELKQDAELAAYRLRILDAAKKRLRKDSLMNYNVTVKTIPERYAATLRMTLPSYDAEGMAWDILCSETDSMNLIPDDPCLCSVIFHDSEYKESDVDVEIQKTVRGSYPDTEHVVFKTEPAVTVASCIHNGSYLGLDDAMRAAAEWVRSSGYNFSGPTFCIYHVSPHETQDSDKFVTEICYPVTKK